MNAYQAGTRRLATSFRNLYFPLGKKNWFLCEVSCRNVGVVLLLVREGTIKQVRYEAPACSLANRENNRRTIITDTYRSEKERASLGQTSQSLHPS